MWKSLPYFVLPSFFMVFLVFLSSIQVGYGQDKIDKLDELIDLYGEYGLFNGSVLVAENGKVIYKKGVGMANMEWDIPNAPDTKHRLGSITKQFTAALILQLVAEGKLKLDEPITAYLPDYPKANGNKITLHDLLTHTSGIPNYTSFPKFFEERSRNPYTVEEFVKVFADSTLQFIPGETFAYSNSGYFLLGAIIEKVTGKSYEDQLEKRIFTPLKMNNSGFDHHENMLKKRATGYQKLGNGYQNSSYLDMSIPYSAGSLYATVEDLYLWDQALYTDQILNKESKDLMFAQYIPAFEGHYGYGWNMVRRPKGNSKDSVETIGHGGGINGFNTLITRFPVEKNLIVLLNNTGGAPLDEITTAMSGILYGKPYDMPKKSVANSLSGVINEKNIAAGLEHFKQLKDAEDYSLKEDEMNSVGYQFLRSDNIEAAMAIFKLNVEEYPKSSNVYDSYGEALMKKGDKGNAIINYKKSLELNPGNTNAMDKLKKMGVATEGLIKEVTVEPTILESYVGKYQLQPGFVITVRKEGDQLKAQATGQPEFEIYPKAKNIFYLKVVAAELTFNKNDQGAVESLTLNQGGQQLVGKRLQE
ncbi:serine hydrolase [Pricia sp.]|uniref:serine hydrolase n=1 Tax=Pricia sp. TaxID=2268138 RepID=UPI003593694F